MGGTKKSALEWWYATSKHASKTRQNRKNMHIIELRGGHSEEARRSHTRTHTHASPHATMPPTYRSFKRDPLRPVLRILRTSAGQA